MVVLAEQSTKGQADNEEDSWEGVGNELGGVCDMRSEWSGVVRD
jgi:hypothetical protein